MTPGELLTLLDPSHHPAPGTRPPSNPYPNGVWPKDTRPNRVPSTARPVEALIEEEGARLEKSRQEWRRLGWKLP